MRDERSVVPAKAGTRGPASRTPLGRRFRGDDVSRADTVTHVGSHQSLPGSGELRSGTALQCSFPRSIAK